MKIPPQLAQDARMQVGTDPTEADAAELRRLRWRCRRGMRELDQLLVRWLERCWLAASDDQRGVFLRLLDSEDDRLWRWFLGHEAPPDAALHALVNSIRDLPH